MLREQVSRFRPARISAQIMPIGVRDMVLPPIPTESPSRTKEVASSSETKTRSGSAAAPCRTAPDSSEPCCRPVCPWSLPYRSAGAGGADLRVEILDQMIPHRYRLHETAPESLVLAPFEIIDRYALLLHPGEVAEIENTLAVEMGQLEHVVVRDPFQMAAEDLGGIDLVETIPIAAGEKPFPLAGIEQRAVGRYRHDHVIGAKIKMLGDLYGGDDIRKPRDADIVEGPHHVRIDLAPAHQVAASGIAAEKQIERIAGQIGHADDEVGIHDVVDQRDVLVPDALDVVLAVSIAEHGRAFDGLGRGDLGAVPRFQVVAGRDGS